MLQPTSARLEAANETAALIAAFKANGGSITQEAPGVSQHLRKTKYVGRKAHIGVDPRLGSEEK